MRAIVFCALVAGAAAMPFEAQARVKIRIPSAKAAPSTAPSSAARAVPDKPVSGVATPGSGTSRTTVIVVPRIGGTRSGSSQAEDNSASGQGQVFKAGMRPFVARAQPDAGQDEQAKAGAPPRAAVPMMGAEKAERVSVPSFEKMN